MSDDNEEVFEDDDDLDEGDEIDEDAPPSSLGPPDAEAQGDNGAQPSGEGRGRGRGPRRPRRQEEEFTSTDERTNMALKFVSDVVREMEMDCKVLLRRPKDGNAEDEINIEIAGKDAGRIIGKKGQVLQALQFLTHRIVNRPGLDRRHILVDAEGYRSRRDNSLATMARRLGRQAVEEGKIITFEPMNPRDRRVVHLALAKFEGVITRSDGEGDDRRVQIIPVRRSGTGTGTGTGTATPL
jgi:spoIIIJ-associated protein